MTSIGVLLVGGFLVFMTGAVLWRPAAYEQPVEVALPLMHADRRRLRWIHWWMIPAIFLTIGGLGGLAWFVSNAGVAIAAVVYAAGGVLWVLALSFRETVGEWAARQAAETGSVPPVYLPLSSWMGLCHAIHMMTAYVTAIPLGWSLAEAGLIPGWLGWAGAVWGLVLGAVLLVPAIRFVAQPPFWAHTFTGAVGLALLL